MTCLQDMNIHVAKSICSMAAIQIKGTACGLYNVHANRAVRIWQLGS